VRSLLLASGDLGLLGAADLLLSALDFLKSFTANLLLDDEFRLNHQVSVCVKIRVSALRYYYLISNETELSTHKTTRSSRSFAEE
jgi:hypothetical protein